MTARFFFLMSALACAWAGIARAELKVVATVPDLAAIARAVGREHVAVTSMSLATQDPHFVDPKPSLALALNQADLLLVVGLQLEAGWLPPLLAGARNADVQPGSRGYLDCSTLVRLLEVPAQRIDRSMGDLHPGGNSHYLFDPRAAVAVAHGVAKRMGDLDPAHREAYRSGAEAFAARADALRREWEKRLSGLRGASVIAYHRTWPYLADWLGFTVVEHLEPKPGVPPTPAHVAQLLSLARSQKVHLVLLEDYQPDTAAALLARQAGAELVKLPGGTRFQQGQGYFEHLEAIVSALERAAGRKEM